MQNTIRDLKSWGRCGAATASPLACLALALLAGCAGGAGPGDGTGPVPDPERDGCAPYDYYTDGAVPWRPAAAWTGGLIQDVAVDGTLAVLAGANCGLRVVDVADPAAPRLLGTAACLSAVAVALEGRLAAVAEGDRGFSLYDLQDPAAPELLVRVPVTGAGESSRYTDAVTLDGDRLYVAGFHRQLVCFDVTDPRRPVERGRLVLDRPGDLAVRGGRLFAGARAVVDVATDGRLTLRQVLDEGAAEDLLLVGDRLHAAVEEGLATFDVGDPDTVTLADLRPVGRARCLAADGDRVYVGVGAPDPRLKVFAFGAGAEPDLVADARAAGYVAFYALARVDRVLLAGDRWLRTIAIDDPLQPVFAPEPDEPAYPQGLAVLPGFAVVADGPLACVYALGEAAAAAPTAVHDLGQSILHMAANSRRVYIVRNANGLVVLDPAAAGAPPAYVSAAIRFGVLAASDSLLATGTGGKLRLYGLQDPGAPRFLGELDLGDYVKQVAVSGTRVLVSLAAQQLVLVDASDPAQPVVEARDLQDLGLRDSAAVVWADSVGLDYHLDGVLRVVRPDAEGRLQTIGAMVTGGEGHGLLRQGPVVYTLCREPWGGASHLGAVDLADPAHPALIGRADQPEAVMTYVALGDERIYALTAGGLLRFWLDCRSLD